MKIQCQVAHKCHEEDCFIASVDGHTGYIEVPNLDTLIGAKGTDEFDFFNANTTSLPTTVEKNSLHNFNFTKD